MIAAIGFLETNSIARGIQAADAVVKAAEIELITARPCCPGKYQIVFSGEVAAVTASLEAGIRSAEGYAVDSVVIPRIHPMVIEAIGMACHPVEMQAVGVMEFFSMTAAVYAADAAVKAADVQLLDVRLGTGIGGKSYVILTGEVAAVSESVSCGTAAAAERGMVFEQCVIPNPCAELLENLY
ncbi:MAG: BMC domain-containing protein [Clostridiaceae bacterium]